MFKNDLTGKVFGELKVISYNEEESKRTKRTTWNCECEKGHVISVRAGNLISGNTKSCRICGKERGYLKDLTGKKFGKLTVLNYEYNRKNYSYWKCKCDCGNELIIRQDSLTTGNTKSCGCYLAEMCREKFDHRTEEKLYHVLYAMKQRCYNTNDKNYHHYGGRGIQICDEWNNLETGYMNFKNWAYQHGYQEGLTIDRIDVNGNYEPENCRWTTMEVQAENKRLNNYYTYDRKSMLLKDWSKILGIKESTLYSRINTLGWNVDRAFTEPVGYFNEHNQTEMKSYRK